MPRASRLARASDIRRCLTYGRRRRLEHLDMIWIDNSTGQPRVGLIVPKFQSSAVARNRYGAGCGRSGGGTFRNTIARAIW